MLRGQIEDILSGALVTGSGYSQHFFAPKNARWPAGTTYDQGGNLTFGKWETQGHRYCSVWPPNETWSCYKMFIDQKDKETWLIWVDDSDRRFEGKLQK